MNPFRRSFLVTFGLLLLVAVSFAGGYLLHDTIGGLQPGFPIFSQAYEILTRNGLKDLPAGPAPEYGMIRGLLQAYNDPYTIFVEPAQHELEGNALQGSFGGIGVNMEKDAQGNWLLYPFPDGPAQKAGVQDGDRLLAVEAMQITAETTAEAIQSAVRGPAGQRVSITIGRVPDFTPQTFEIRREEIPLPSVTWRLAPDEPRAGIVQVNLITAQTAEEIQRAVEDLQGRGAQDFVLDLRNNPGGLLTAGVDIARLFLKDGVVIQQQYRGRDVETFEVKKPGPLADLPLIILINKGSASAAEIVAGSLQARQRARLVGEASYGKDTVQLVFDLKDGSSLHVTSARWWVPGLEPPLGGVGLQPDVPVQPAADPNGPDPAVQAAVQALLEPK